MNDLAPPTFDFAPFIAYWQARADSFTATTFDAMVSTWPHYAALPREALLDSIRRKIQLYQDMLRTGDVIPVIERTHELVFARIDSRMPLNEMLGAADIFRDQIWQLMREFYPADQWPIDAVEQFERWVRADRNEAGVAYSKAMFAIWGELDERSEQLEQQQRLVADLSTPLMPIHAGVLVLPLVGYLDQRRATRVMEIALEQIVVAQADVLIVDLTGVPLVDQAVANNLLQLIRAVRLIGAHMVLVGISAEIAQTIVALEVNLSDLVIRSNLQQGIAYALELQGLVIREREAAVLG